MVDSRAHPLRVFDFTEEDVDAVALVLLEDMLESEVDREGEEAAYHKEYGCVVVAFGVAFREPHKEVE
jgi:hypothetical protein